MSSRSRTDATSSPSTTSPHARHPLPAAGGGFDLYDVSNPLSPQILVQGFGDTGGEGDLSGANPYANQYHSVFIWDVGTTAYLVGVDNEEFHDIDIFDISDPRNPQPVREYDAIDSFPDAWTETANGDNVLHHDMVVKQINNRWTMLSSYWDMGYLQLDVSDPENATLIADTDFTGEDPLTGFDPPEGNAHQAEFTNDNKYIVTAEEDFSAFRLIEVDVEPRGGEPVGLPHRPALADGARCITLGYPVLRRLALHRRWLHPVGDPRGDHERDRHASRSVVRCGFHEPRWRTPRRAGYSMVYVFNSQTGANAQCETLLNMDVLRTTSARHPCRVLRPPQRRLSG